jgi:uncharacterized membrane protein
MKPGSMTDAKSVRSVRWLATFAKPVTKLGWFVWGAVATNVALQIAYPLVSKIGQRFVTIGSVIAFFSASLFHAFETRGRRAAIGLVVFGAGGGLVVEAIGWRTGFPFGNYRYGSSLGVKILGVPLVVPLAWAMMGWVALLCGRRVVATLNSSTNRWFSSLVVGFIGALILVTWDLFLDPQMVRAGHWIWLDTIGPSLHGIPVVNSIGWLLVGMLMIAALHTIVPRTARVDSNDNAVWVLLAWTWFSQWFGHLVFFHRPSVALVGGVCMTMVCAIVVNPRILRAFLVVAARS